MQARTVEQWVEYIQTLHFREIELSLERVREVYLRLYPNGLPFKIISLAGTNGKGSTAAMLSSIYRCSGYKVGKFTSPHLVSFSERYELDGNNISDKDLLESFLKIECARADTAITFFEYGALLAIDLFASARVDIAIMEVGLGGRLDAINILDADVSIITSISIDHTAWLGNSIEAIAFEKAGIARSQRPCVVGIQEPPKTIIEHCADIDAELKYIGRDFEVQYVDGQDHWLWRSDEMLIDELPLPFLQSGVQLSNASAALQAVRELEHDLPVDSSAIRRGLAAAEVLARCQILSSDPMIVLDVSHNEASVKRLAEFLNKQKSSGRVVAVVGMLLDKEIGPSLRHLSGLVEQWNFASIDGERGASARHVREQLEPSVSDQISDSMRCFDKVEHAFDSAFKELKSGDLLVVFGSFYIAGDILAHVRGLGLAS